MDLPKRVVAASLKQTPASNPEMTALVILPTPPIKNIDDARSRRKPGYPRAVETSLALLYQLRPFLLLDF